jgi:hypothetical protein
MGSFHSARSMRWVAGALLVALAPRIARGQEAPNVVPARPPQPTSPVPPTNNNVPAPPRLLLSEWLIQPRGDSQVQKGSLLVPNLELERLVADSPEALRLARSADDDLRLGGVLSGSGVGAALVGVILVPVGTGLSKNPDGTLTSQATATLTTATVFIAVAIGLLIAGGVVSSNAMDDWYRAVNIYNSQLVDGKLSR